MPQDQELTRFAELLQAFADLVRGRSDVRLRGSASPPPLGFAVRLQPEPTSPGVELCLWIDRGKLSTWSGEGRHPLLGHDDRYLQVDLSEGFRWGAKRYPDAGQLAGTLLGWMEREIGGVRRARMEVLG